MKFLCPNCKAKYQIADEKVSGRTLRMDCRRCGHNITIRADMRIDEAEEVEPSAKPSVRLAGAARSGSVVGPNPLSGPRAPRGSTLTGAHAATPVAHGGSALGADFRRNATSAPEAPRTTPLDQWHVAINDVPVGPLRREEILKKMAAGAVTADSLCWREGLDDWRPLRDVPELAALLRRSLTAEPMARGPVPRGPAAAPPRAAPTPRAAPAARPMGNSNVVPIGGRLGASAAALDEHEVDDGTNEPTRVGTVDLAELEARALAAEREGKRASEAARAEAKLADARAAEAKATELGAADARGAENAAEALEGKRPPTGKITTRPVTAPPPKPLGKPDTGKIPLGVPPKPGVPAKPTPRLEPEADELPIAEPSFAATPEPVAPVAATAPAPTPAPTATPAPNLTPAPVLTPAPATAAPPPKATEREERRGLPVGAWIAIAGAISFGGVLAVMVGNHFLRTPPAPAASGTATVQPPTPPSVPEAPVVEPPPPVVEEPATVVEAPTADAPVAPPSEPQHAGATPRRGSGTGSTPTTPTAPSAPTGATAATKTAPTGRFADFADSPSGGGPAAIQTGSPRSLVDEAEGPSARSGQTELTADQIRAVITRERPALNRCWESELRRLGQATTVRLDVDLSIGGSGTVTSVTTRGQSVGTLSECIERNVRRWRFPPVSGSTQTSFPLVFAGTE